jgi:SAM-dependent methyltransferase
MTDSSTGTRTLSPRRGRRARKRGGTDASRADRHALYERSVQDVETDAETLARLYKRYRKREALVLREDFCGTAALCTQWVRAKAGRKAVGVDLDAPTLAWGLEHHVESSAPDVRRRIELFEANVLDGIGPRADLTCALNFSYSVFKRRADLCDYFRVVRRGLKKDGLFMLDVWGGPEAIMPDENRHDMGDFVYRWEQARFDPLTHEMLCHIHFEFPDGSSMDRAFTYDWRFWSVPELRDMLDEAGFTKVHALWEKTDAKGEGTGAFYEPRRVENQESWWTYLVAER